MGTAAATSDRVLLKVRPSILIELLSISKRQKESRVTVDGVSRSDGKDGFLFHTK